MCVQSQKLLQIQPKMGQTSKRLLNICYHFFAVVADEIGRSGARITGRGSGRTRLRPPRRPRAPSLGTPARSSSTSTPISPSLASETSVEAGLLSRANLPFVTSPCRQQDQQCVSVSVIVCVSYFLGKQLWGRFVLFQSSFEYDQKAPMKSIDRTVNGKSELIQTQI